VAKDDEEQAADNAGVAVGASLDNNRVLFSMRKLAKSTLPSHNLNPTLTRHYQ
jgi:hypothetical protein